MSLPKTPHIFNGKSPTPLFEADWMQSSYTSSQSPIIIGGCARSGTTLMSILLDSHRRICCGPESCLFEAKPIIMNYLSKQFDLFETEILKIYQEVHSRGEFINRFAQRYCLKRNKIRWAEKTAKNVRNIRFIFRVFPRARFINMIRDGRDVVCSLRNHPKERLKDGNIVETGIVNPIDICIERWVADVNISREFWNDSRFLTIKYEDLVNDIKNCLPGIFSFLDEPWDDNVLEHTKISSPSRSPHRLVTNRNVTNPITNRSVGRWRCDLKEEERLQFKGKAGDLLIELGYEKNNHW